MAICQTEKCCQLNAAESAGTAGSAAASVAITKQMLARDTTIADR